MILLAKILTMIINIYIWIIIAWVAVTWLINFKVLNTDNPQARNLVDLLNKAVDPVMKPVAKHVPPIGGIDLTPLVVIIALTILESLIWMIVV